MSGFANTILTIITIFFIAMVIITMKQKRREKDVTGRIQNTASYISFTYATALLSFLLVWILWTFAVMVFFTLIGSNCFDFFSPAKNCGPTLMAALILSLSGAAFAGVYLYKTEIKPLKR